MGEPSLFVDLTGWCRCIVSLGGMLLVVGWLVATPTPISAQDREIKFGRLSVEDGLSQNAVRCILQDHQGFMWFGTDDGLNKFDGYRFTHYKNHLGGASSLSNNTINVIYEDKSGTLWVGTNGGLNRFDRRTETFRHFRDDPRNPQSLSDKLVSAIFEDHAGTLWIGTWGGGPDSFDPATQTFIHCTEAEGLSNAEINGIVENANTNFWISTNKSLAKFNPDQHSFKNYGEWNEEGVSIKIMIAPPWWRTWWAYMLFGMMISGFLYGIRRYEMNRQQWKHGLELVRLETDKLKELDRLKSRFFANISHEFRTPLTLILGPLENLRSGRFNGNTDKEYRMMERNARRLLRLINQLLDLSKLEAGKLTLQASCGNLIPFIKGIVYSFESLAERKQITLRFEVEAKEIMLYFDGDKLEKIVTNLLSNAFKNTPEGGNVIVSVKHGQSVWVRGRRGERETMNAPIPPITHSPSPPLSTGNFVIVKIEDTGTGISADCLAHIFDRFYTRTDSHVEDHRAPLDSSHQSKRPSSFEAYPMGQGIGIGLALTKELVELHHGEIHVTSEVGQGTTFTIRLPMAKDHLVDDEIVESVGNEAESSKLQVVSEHEVFTPSIQASIDPSIQPLASGNEQPVLLIVEDNPDMGAFIRDQLSDRLHVIEAEDGKAGFEKAADRIPDLIISDVMMPKMDGYQLCEKLKTDERTSHVPVILLTAKSSGESRLEGLELGADDYLIKPFNSRELLARVKNLIEQRRMLRQRFGKEIMLQPRDMAITSTDEKFLERAMAVVEEHISEADFDVETLGRKVGMSRKHLHRKLKALTDQAPREFIRTLRLQRAAQLLEKYAGNVTEVAYEVGFNNLSHFARAFKEQFGCSPSKFTPA